MILNWEKICTNPTSFKGLTHKMCKEGMHTSLEQENTSLSYKIGQEAWIARKHSKEKALTITNHQKKTNEWHSEILQNTCSIGNYPNVIK